MGRMLSIYRVQIFFLSVTIACANPLFPIENIGPVENHLSGEANNETDYRLSRNVIPSKYVIRLEPNIENFTFVGQTNISVTIEKATTEIILHAKDLVVTENPTVSCANVSFSVNTFDINNITDFLKINLASAASGSCQIGLSYTGIIHTDLYGFYASKYINEFGDEVWLATTQFEPTWARRAFPCFDEPSFKATFKISIVHTDDYEAISNMPAESKWPIREGEIDYTKWLTTFEETPIMSTYLVAFVVSDFNFLQTKGGKFRVWAKGDVKHTGQFALDVGPKELAELESRLKHSYVVPVMNNFAIPQSAAGAMENWGLVTYRENALLTVKNVTTTFNKQNIATVISHEFTHQWFGNLVSPSWWDHVWLSEGFADFFQYFITDKVKPKWRLMEQFVISNLQETAFVADAKEDQHPMNAKVNSPEQIAKIFDSISSSKAGCVIRMILHVLTEPTFNKGLQMYLDQKKYSFATPADLFDAFANVSDHKVPNLKAMLDSWANQAGYPVITVSRNHTTGSLDVTQKRFLENSTKPSEAQWIIPINYASEDEPIFNETAPKTYLLNDGKPYTTSGFKKDKWVIFNKQQTGYYRVNYDALNWKLIANYLESNKTSQIHVLNRAQLLDDSFRLAEAGELPDYTAFLDLTKYLRTEVDYIPWYSADRAISTLNKRLVNTEIYDLFKLYILRLIEKIETNVGYTITDKDDYITAFSRVTAISLASSMGSKNCLAATHDALIDHIGGTKSLAPDLKQAVYCAGIRTANASIWEETFQFAAEMEDASERSLVISALGCSSDSDILKSYLNKTLLAITPPVSTSSRNPVITSVYQNSAAGIEIAFDFIRDNFARIYTADNNNSDSILTHLNAIGQRMTTRQQVEKLKKLIDSLSDEHKTLKVALNEKALVSAETNVLWVEKHGPHIDTFLKAQDLIDDGNTNEDENNSSNMWLSNNLLIVAIALKIALSRFY